MTNINNHVRDNSSEVIVAAGSHPFGTPPGSSLNLQQALNQFHPSALVPIPLPSVATETSKGIIEVATLSEVNLRQIDNAAITAYKLTQDLTLNPATETRWGFIKINDEALPNEGVGNSTDVAITVDSLNMYCTNRVSTIPGADSRYPSGHGTAIFATSAEAVPDPTGVVLPTNNTKVMRPKQTVESILAYSSSKRATATETIQGAVKLATQAEAEAGAKWGVLTPYSINFKFATETNRGFFQILDAPTIAAAESFNETHFYRDYVITPGTINSFIPTPTRFGFVQLNNTLTSTSTSFALTAAMGKQLQDTKIGETGGTITGTLKLNNLYSTITVLDRYQSGTKWVYFNSTKTVASINNGMVNVDSALEGRPVGSIYMSTVPTDPHDLFGGKWEEISGRVLVGQGEGTDARNQKRYFYSRMTGGEFRNVITTSNLPEHKHAGWGEHWTNVEEVCLEYEYNAYGGPIGCKSRTWTSEAAKFGYSTEYGRSNVGSGKSDKDNYLYYNEPVGGSQPHNNIMPYKVVYIWRRTA